MPASSPRHPGRFTTDTATATACRVRVPRRRRGGVQSAADQGLGGHSGYRGVSLVARLDDASAPPDGRWVATATFAEPGDYVLRAMAHDGGLATAADVAVTVTP